MNMLFYDIANGVSTRIDYSKSIGVQCVLFIYTSGLTAYWQEFTALTDVMGYSADLFGSVSSLSSRDGNAWKHTLLCVIVSSIPEK